MHNKYAYVCIKKPLHINFKTYRLDFLVRANKSIVSYVCILTDIFSWPNIKVARAI